MDFADYRGTLNELRGFLINKITEYFNKYAVDNNRDKVFFIQNNSECINEGYSILVKDFSLDDGNYSTDSVDYLSQRNGSTTIYTGDFDRELSELYADELADIVEMIENLIEDNEIEECANSWEG